MVIDKVFEEIIERFKKAEKLNVVDNYHKVNGILPDIGTSISMGCEEIKFQVYDNSLDEASTDINIFVYTQESDPEEGEKVIRNLAHEIRVELLKDITLNGLISSGEVKDIQFIYADTSETMYWHAAMIVFDVTYYEDRY